MELCRLNKNSALVFCSSLPNRDREGAVRSNSFFRSLL